MQNWTKLLSKKNVSVIRKELANIPFAEIADMMEHLSSNQKVVLLKSLKTEDQSKVFTFLSSQAQEDIVKSFTSFQIKKLIDKLYTEEAADVIEDLSPNLAYKILSITSLERRKEINDILNYNDDQVGSFMSVDIMTLLETWTVGHALKEIKKNIDEIHFSKYFYVVDKKKHLKGYVKIRDIIFEDKKKSIKKFIKAATYVKITTDKEKASQIFAKHEMSSLPVVDDKNEVIGIINSDSVIDIIQEEANEDFRVMAGIQASFEEPYSKTSVAKLFKSRVMWLLLLMISSTLSQIVLDNFLQIVGSSIKEENQITIVGITSAMVAILPVISGVAGNAGSQSSTTIIRALTTGDLSNKDYFKVFGKELRTSTLIGLVLGIANFIRLIIYYASTGYINDVRYISLSGAASLSLMLVVILSQIVGGILPILAKIFKLDPAVMAAPVLTTLIDALSILIFFSISIGIMIMVV